MIITEFNGKLIPIEQKEALMEYAYIEVTKHTFALDTPRPAVGSGETRKGPHNGRLKISTKDPKNHDYTISFPIIRDSSTKSGYSLVMYGKECEIGDKLKGKEIREIIDNAILIEKYAMTQLGACYEDNTSEKAKENFAKAIEEMNENKRKLLDEL